MKTNIRTRLFLTVLFATGTSVVGMYFFIHWSFDRGFLEYVNVQQERQVDSLSFRLEQIYTEEGDWQRFRRDKVRWAKLLFDTFGYGLLGRSVLRHLRAGTHSGRWPPATLKGPVRSLLPEIIFRLMLLDQDKSVIFGRKDNVPRVRLRALTSKGKTVGYLGLLPNPKLSAEHDLRFAQQQGESFLLIALFMILVSAGLALPLAHRFLRPVRALQKATQKMAAGDYAVRLRVTEDDELGRLARDFNDLGKTLTHNEQLRRQWVADISHELRTPLAILRGEIEALQDGVRQPTPEALASLNGEVRHLARLVDDLYELSMSDVGALTYRKREIEPLTLLRDCAQSMAGDFEAADIGLDTRGIPSEHLILQGDRDRLSQLFNNLLSNTLRYTDPGGTLEIAACPKNERLDIDFQDSPPGVPEQEHAKLFDRLYRVDGSRNRARGGAGLGLAISHNIVTAHGGNISAGTSPLGGLWIHIELPLNGSQHK